MKVKTNKMITKVFKSITAEGLPAKTFVTVTDEGAVIIEQRSFVTDLSVGVARKWKNYYYTIRLVAIKRESLGIIMAIISDSIEKLKLHEKYPENFTRLISTKDF
jgi:hypothetical protein